MLQETHIEQLNARKQEICESCELDQIKLPTTDSSMDIDSAGSSQQTQTNVSFDFSKLDRVHRQVVFMLNFDLSCHILYSSAM
jgi:hypothetical protein